MWANSIKPYPVGLFHGYLDVPLVSCRHLEELIARSGVVSRERRRTGGPGSRWRAVLCGYGLEIGGDVFTRIRVIGDKQLLAVRSSVRPHGTVRFPIDAFS
jgi:hypothetical protein